MDKKQKYKSEEEEFLTSTGGDQKFSASGSLKIDNDFFKDEDYVPQDLFRVKNVKLKNGSQSWELIKNGKIELILRHINFTKKEAEYLNTVNGSQFLLSSYKAGIKSVNKFKQELKKVAK